MHQVWNPGSHVQGGPLSFPEAVARSQWGTHLAHKPRWNPIIENWVRNLWSCWPPIRCEALASLSSSAITSSCSSPLNSGSMNLSNRRCCNWSLRLDLSVGTSSLLVWVPLHDRTGPLVKGAARSGCSAAVTAPAVRLQASSAGLAAARACIYTCSPSGPNENAFLSCRTIKSIRFSILVARDCRC